MTTWETPSFTEVDMSAEIGGYQGEEERPDYGPAFVRDAASVAKPAPGDA